MRRPGSPWALRPLQGDGSAPPAKGLTLRIQKVSVGPDLARVGWMDYAVLESLTVTTSSGPTGPPRSAAMFVFRQVPAGSQRWAIAEWDDPVLWEWLLRKYRGPAPTASS